MHKIVALWAVPRSTSTAFEWMMRQRGDMDCLHEPFGEAWYQGEEPLWQRWKPGDAITPGLTLDSVWADIQARAEASPVFTKDFPHYINHMWDAEFLSHLTHAFLIRDPAKTITSMYDKWPDFHEGEVGFPEQRALFDLLWALAENAGRVMSRDALMNRIRGRSAEAYDRSIDVHISRIRAAIEDEPKHPRRLITVRGAGYSFVAPRI